MEKSLKSKYLKRFDLHLTPEQLIIIHLALSSNVTLQCIPENLQPYFLALQKEISKEVLSFKSIANEIQIQH